MSTLSTLPSWAVNPECRGLLVAMIDNPPPAYPRRDGWGSGLHYSGKLAGQLRRHYDAWLDARIAATIGSPSADEALRAELAAIDDADRLIGRLLDGAFDLATLAVTDLGGEWKRAAA